MVRFTALSAVILTCACGPGTLRETSTEADRDSGDSLADLETNPESETSSSTTEGASETSTSTGDAVVEPTPPFWMAAGIPSGSVAIDEEGITTFVVDGEEYDSQLTFVLESASQPACRVVVIPHFVRFDTTETSWTPSMTFGLGESVIVADECGWDDDYILAEFAMLGTVTFGLSHDPISREDDLDLSYTRSWPFGYGYDMLFLRNGASGVELNADGELVEDAPLKPRNQLLSGFYEW